GYQTLRMSSTGHWVLSGQKLAAGPLYLVLALFLSHAASTAGTTSSSGRGWTSDSWGAGTAHMGRSGTGQGGLMLFFEQKTLTLLATSSFHFQSGTGFLDRSTSRCSLRNSLRPA